MNCREWENLLDELLEDGLAPERREAAERHLSGCPACRGLFAAARRNKAVLSPDQEQDLTAAILARTSGPACGRAEDRLGDFVTGVLAGTEADLVGAHLDHCARCAELAETVAWLDGVLPEMGKIEVPADFTAAVLARTTRAPSRVQALAGRLGQRTRHATGELGARLPGAGLVRRLGEWWERTRLRPRFSLEAAYLGTVLLIGLFGTPLSPFKSATPKALDAVKAGPEVVASTVGPGLDAVGGALGRGGRWAWRNTGGALGGAVSGVSAGIDERNRRAAPAARDLREHSGQLGRSLVRVDFVAAALHLDEVRGDLGQLWHQWWQAPRPAAGETGNHDRAPPTGAPADRNDKANNRAD